MFSKQLDIHRKVAIITGASRGIGRSLAELLIKKNIYVIAIARSEQDLESLKLENKGMIQVVACDIATADGQQAVINTIQLINCKIDYLVHNAAVIHPITNIEFIKEKDLRYQLDTNFFAPLFLTQKLLPYMSKSESRIMAISSVAAEQAVKGLGGYCMSKSALNMWVELLKNELQDSKISIATIIPGEVDTEMQQELREAPTENFSLAGEFQKALQENTLIDPSLCAAFLSYVLTSTSIKEFKIKKWNIYDSSHHANWLEKNVLPLPLNKNKTAGAKLEYNEVKKKANSYKKFTLFNYEHFQISWNNASKNDWKVIQRLFVAGYMSAYHQQALSDAAISKQTEKVIEVWHKLH